MLYACSLVSWLFRSSSSSPLRGNTLVNTIWRLLWKLLYSQNRQCLSTAQKYEIINQFNLQLNKVAVRHLGCSIDSFGWFSVNCNDSKDLHSFCMSILAKYLWFLIVHNWMTIPIPVIRGHCADTTGPHHERRIFVVRPVVCRSSYWAPKKRTILIKANKQMEKHWT